MKVEATTRDGAYLSFDDVTNIDDMNGWVILRTKDGYHRLAENTLARYSVSGQKE